ncbi:MULTISPECIES: spore germination protein GerW family protein [unclassified Nocardia]|uniref:spore germination protein GerW family protein n=1 Tax=unclassified Nocardia TaxID=2637762 RepID=UPI00278BCC0F|nr:MULTISPECIES: spore germination protein GerW family protein [unclassified Nocardia]
MKVEELLAAAKDNATVKRVYAEPVERDGITVIAAAAVSGGAGGGGGHDKEGQEGSGGGYGIGAKPVGAFVLQDGQLRWQPAVDVNRVITVAGFVIAIAMIIGARIARAHER